MFIKKLVTPLLLVGLFVATGVFAADEEAPVVESSERINPFSDCGLGAAIFKNDVGAAISNVIWDLGTTAVTSGVSTPNTCGKDSTDVARFILHTYPNISEETAKGKGAHLTAMLNFAGCNANAHEEIISDIRVNFSKSISSGDYVEKSAMQKSEDYYDIVIGQVSGSHSSQCDMS